MSQLTNSGQAAVWVHGHLHHSVNMVRTGGVRIVCSPAGPGFSNPDIQDDLVVEV